jgi:uncharacterized protein YqeY
MLNISKLLVESKKHKFDNREAVIAVLTELKNKEIILTKDKTVKRSAEQQYIWLREMQKQKENNIAIYQAEYKQDLLIKEKNELKAINQFIPLVLNFLSPVKIEDEITAEILSIMSKNYGLRDIMEYFKSKYPTIDKNLVSKLAKKILQK